MKPVNTIKVSLIALMIVFCLSLNTQTFADSSDCPASFIQGAVIWDFRWDPDNPKVINQNSSEEVNVIGGNAPYTWSVEGNGFSLAFDQTQGLTNTLQTDATACGSALIKVKDSNKHEVAGIIRHNDPDEIDSTWVLKSTDQCEMPGEGSLVESNQYDAGGEYISGKGKQVEWISKYYRSNVYSCSEDACEGFTGSTFGGQCTLGQTRCLSFPTMPYDGGWPCADPLDGVHYVWCGCIKLWEYYEWECK